MAGSQSEQISKHYENRAKTGTELRKYQQQIMEAVDKAEAKARVERLVNSCEGALAKTFGKHKQLYSFAKKLKTPML